MEKTRFILLFLVQLLLITIVTKGQNRDAKQLDKDRGFNDVKLGMDFSEIPGIDMLGRRYTYKDETPFWKEYRNDEKLEFRNIKLSQVHYGFINTKLNSIKVWFNPVDYDEFFSILTNLYGEPYLNKPLNKGDPEFYEWEYGKTILALSEYCQNCNIIAEWTLKGSDKRMRRFLKRFKSEEEEVDFINLIVYTKMMGKKEAKKVLKKLKAESENNHWMPPPPMDDRKNQR